MRPFMIHYTASKHAVLRDKPRGLAAELSRALSACIDLGTGTCWAPLRAGEITTQLAHMGTPVMPPYVSMAEGLSPRLLAGVRRSQMSHHRSGDFG